MRSTITIAMAAVLFTGAACSPQGSSSAGGRRSGAERARLEAHGRGAARTGHAAALLGDGRVLLAGGTISSTPTRTAELFDPSTGEFTSTAGDLSAARVGATATVLLDGRVLIAGGDDAGTVDLYDPVERTFTPAAPLGGRRAHHTATRLGNGHVVVAGGFDGTTPLASVMEYTPGAPGTGGSWDTFTVPLIAARAHHTATLLGNGTLLIAGGEDASGALQADTAERYTPTGAGATTAVGGLSPRTRHAAALLTTGDVLVVGGADGGAPLGSVAIYAAGAFSGTADAVTARSELTASLLPDGRVVVAGGRAGGAAQNAVDVFDVDGDLLSSAGHLEAARGGHAATVLPSGRVLLTGGGLDGAEVLDRAQDRWQTITPTNYNARYGHTATLLPLLHPGEVLLVGGRSGLSSYERGSQLWDPDAPAILPLPAQLANVRAYHTATVLLDGTVLVAGGNSGEVSRQDAEIFDGGAWSAVPAPMMAPRSHHTATLLTNGKVLFTGGVVNAKPPVTVLSSAEVYDPVTQTFSPTGSNMSWPRANHTATLLPDGRVLVAGGGNASADVYDPTLNVFTPVGNLTVSRDRFSASPLADGRVLLGGGTNGTIELGSAELFDGAGTFAAISGGAPMPRLDHAAALLPAGEVLIAGGQDAGGFLDDVERYEPSSQSFLTTLVSSLGDPRGQFTATQLPSGQILAWGGDNGGLGVYPELYDPFVPATPPPDLAGAPGAAVPTQVLELDASGGSFTGPGGADQPVFVLTRQDGDGILYARTVSFSAAEAHVELPAVAPSGWWWIRAIVGGVPGTARPFRMLAPFRMSPLTPTVPPRGSLPFTATGGSGTGYHWSLTATGSHSDAEATTLPAIDPDTGAYVAGATPDSTDTVQCADALDASVVVTTDVTVGPGITIFPALWAAAPAQEIAFSATGGCDPSVFDPATCTGYTWSYLPGGNRSGGSLSASGAYKAGPTGGVNDDLQVVDALGNHAEASIAVTTPIVIDPTTATVTPLGQLTFTVAGGYATGGYTWSLSSNASGGSVDASGHYTAGRTGSVTDVVRVRDALGSYAEATITVTPGVSLTPAAPSSPPRGAVAFTPAGGNSTFAGCATADGSCWEIVDNRSGGSIDASGHYTAGATPNVTDVVQVQDTLGNLATTAVAVGPGISVSPRDAGAYPGQTVTLTAAGGSGTGFTWQLTDVASSGGTITPLGANTAVYRAGTRRGATDLLLVTDDLGNEATVDLVVWPDWKPAGSGCSSTGGGGGALGLALVVLWLAARRRSRRLVRAAVRIGGALGLLLAAGAPRAQVPPVSQSFIVDRFQPAGGAYDVLGVQSAQTPGHLQKTFRLYLNYASRPLVLKAPGMDKVALVKSQLAADLTASLGYADWGELTLAVPFMVSQKREQDRFLPPDLRQDVASSGLGDIRLTPKARLLELGKFRLGASVPVGLPTGNKEAFLGHGALTVAPTALVEIDAVGPARLLFNAGAIFRPERKLVDLTVGNAFTYGAAVEYPFQLSAERLAALATFAGEAGMKASDAARPMEVLGGLRWMASNGLLVSAGGGPGIGKGYGTPQYRVFLELGFTTAGSDRLAEKPREEPPPEEAKPEEPKPEPEAQPAPEPKPEPEPAPAEPAPEQPRAEEPKPEPAPEEPLPQAEPEVLRIDAHVYFDFNKKDLKEEYKPLLRRLARRILAEPRMRVIRIEGHADDLGPPDFNLWLSEERARAVKDFLERSGVPTSRFAVIGFGKTKPTKPGRSSEARAKNRRVEFSVQEY